MVAVASLASRRNRWAAWIDVIQGATGLFLALFIWAHMIMVASILLGKDAMYYVARMFEGVPVFGRPFPVLVGSFAVFILAVVMVHAVLALRRFPNSASQYRTLHRHIRELHHSDTTLWYVQVVTGFLLFFMASIHLYVLITQPGNIGPYASSDRIWSGYMWPLYLVLLFVVETHAGIGFYRVVVKWGLTLGMDPRKARQRLKKFKWALTIFFVTLGLLTLAAYIKIGIDHQDRAGERYVPTWQVQGR